MTCSSSSAEHHGFAFGLHVAGELTPDELPSSRDGADHGRTVRLCRSSDLSAVVCDSRRVDTGRDSAGRVVHAIDADPVHGFRLWGAGYGTFAVSADGTQIDCAIQPGSRWSTYLLGQVLPLTALLHGLEVLHASAVLLDGRCIALAGPSGSGKTALALRMMLEGSEWMTDDVLALAATGDRAVAAHSGPMVAALHPDEETLAGGRLGPALHREEGKARVRMGGAARCAEMGALYLLRRDRSIPRLAFVEVDDPRALLAASFNFVVTGRRRLEHQLEVCARLSRLGVHRVDVPPTMTAAELCAAITAHACRNGS